MGGPLPEGTLEELSAGRREEGGFKRATFHRSSSTTKQAAGSLEVTSGGATAAGSDKF